MPATIKRLGIMQGRLVPSRDERIQCFPRERWPDEFGLAALAGLDSIEWIYDATDADVNPISTDAGIDAIRRLQAESGIVVASVDADYLIQRPLLRVDEHQFEERLAVLRWLIQRAALLGAERIVLPFVDASRIETGEDLDRVTVALDRLAPVALAAHVTLNLEVSLAPRPLGQLLARLPSSSVKVNYDTGNSASFGYDPREEFAEYGQRISSVHVKDRVRDGGTVPLGHGDADLPKVFECLHRLGYTGDIVMEIARGVPDEEVAWAAHNLAYIRELLGRDREGMSHPIRELSSIHPAG